MFPIAGQTAGPIGLIGKVLQAKKKSKFFFQTFFSTSNAGPFSQYIHIVFSTFFSLNIQLRCLNIYFFQDKMFHMGLTQSSVGIKNIHILYPYHLSIHLYKHIYIQRESFIPTDDWVRPMKYFVLEKIYIYTSKMYI